MPRRRLHGETQKRRRKARTRLLKRSESTQRVQVTQQPAPFERASQVEREDLEFLEAMRELDVQRGSWRGEAPARRQAVERVQFLAEDGEQALFLRSMANLGVRALEADGLAESADEPDAPHDPAPERPLDTAAEAATVAAAEPAPDAVAEPDWQPPALPAPVAGNGHAPSAAATEAVRGGVEFAESEDARALMEGLLREADFEPGLKFAGATAPARTRRTARTQGLSDALEPDDELDLHGKTQEEAIRMVQGFLVTCAKRRLRHVVIVTGRGLNSGAGGPVLKDAVRRWLELNGPRFVRTFVQAPSRHGGAGAFWLTLR